MKLKLVGVKRALISDLGMIVERDQVFEVPAGKEWVGPALLAQGDRFVEVKSSKKESEG